MMRTLARWLLLGVTLAAVAVAGVTAFRLVQTSLAAHQADVADRSAVAVLRKQVQEDAGAALTLQARYDRVTAATLARRQSDARLGWTLVVATAVGLVSLKLHAALRQRELAPPRRVVELHRRAIVAAEPDARSPESAGEGHVCTCRPPAADQAEAAVDLAPVDAIVARTGRAADAAIPILHELQRHYRYLPAAALRRVCDLTDITLAQLAGVASFYTQFRDRPVGEHLVTVCHGTACHVAGAPLITNELRRRLHIPAGDDTDAQGRFTLQQVPCLGCCTLAPVVQVDGVTHGHVPADTAVELVQRPPAASVPRARPRLPTTASGGRAAHGIREIRIGLGSCCVANGSGAVYAALHDALAAARVGVAVKRVGCVGMCHQTPFVEIVAATGGNGGGVAELNGHAGATTGNTIYTRVRPQQAQQIVRKHFRTPLGQRVRAALGDVATALNQRRALPPPARTIELRDPPVAAFLDRQVHIATELCGALDPLDLDEYLAHAGFTALARAQQERTPAQLIDEIKASGLRGRGGAGFPTWLKWTKVQQADGAGPKYVICNGDEGDPGAFMDRMLMESYPYRVIEGLAIAARAVGATEGLLYIRAEYPLAVERITAAVRRCTERGLLPIPVRVVQGAGAFVCGEETALIASLQGQRGLPRLRPPYPAEQGLWDRPTLVNNVETLSLVPWIVRNGAPRFAQLGTATSKGTKVFALAGKIARGGLIEVPMGITIGTIVNDIGGGIRQPEPSPNCADGTATTPRRVRQFKAVQIGGPSGGCIPAALADTPVDFEALQAVGAMMGSGGLVVLDDTDCMVDIARYFLSFTQGQSCGKCVPCRVGTHRMLEILERLCAGQGRADDLGALEQLAAATQQLSLCGLGKTAPNPVLTTLRYFRHEYEAHLAGRCPAGKCPALIRYRVTETCTGCTLCAQHCPAAAIELRPYRRHAIDVDKCTRCDVCRARCPEQAIVVE
jgi:NADH-quinone oxidoreductase subunit F